MTRGGTAGRHPSGQAGIDCRGKSGVDSSIRQARGCGRRVWAFRARVQRCGSASGFDPEEFPCERRTAFYPEAALTGLERTRGLSGHRTPGHGARKMTEGSAFSGARPAAAARPGGRSGQRTKTDPAASRPDVNHAPSCRTSRSVLPQVDALPRTQREPTVHERNGQGCRRERRPDVAGHVVWPLEGVRELGIALGHVPTHPSLKVQPRGGIGVFLDDQTRRRMLNHHRA